jgi:general stress protein YciG
MLKRKSGWYGEKNRHMIAGKAGGKKTVQLYGGSFFSLIGKKGGKVSPGNFKHNPQRAKEVGKKGGTIQAKRKRGSRIA